MRSAVRLAAMMPAMRAASSGSPFGVRPPRTASTVSGDISTRAEATARRAVCALALVSTIATRPSSSTCESLLIFQISNLKFKFHKDSAREPDDSDDAARLQLFAGGHDGERLGARE